jgi:hypothetical protein
MSALRDAFGGHPGGLTGPDRGGAVEAAIVGAERGRETEEGLMMLERGRDVAVIGGVAREHRALG